MPAELEITYNESSNWQKLAKVGEEKFVSLDYVRNTNTNLF